MREEACKNFDERGAEILKLFDLGYVNIGISGDFNEVEEEMEKPVEDFIKKDLLNIFNRYHEITTIWFGYNLLPYSRSLFEFFPIRKIGFLLTVL